MIPRKARVRRRWPETPGVFTLDVALDDGQANPFAFAPGQFNMLTVFGAGEVPISISGDPSDAGSLLHTIRDVGAVTHALNGFEAGAVLGLRGPFGAGWPLDEARGRDVVIVAGGLGLAPLRPALHGLLGQRERFGSIELLYGARSPDDILFERELEGWRHRLDLNVEVTVDHAPATWRGHVGVVTTLIARAGFDAPDTMAFVCGPEVMMRFAIKALEDAGVEREAIYLSMERNMKCAVGLCGHCQFGPAVICRDGPVLRYDRVRDLLALKEF